MAVQAAEKDGINVDDDHLNDSLGNPGLISPDKEDLSRLLTVPFSGRIRGGMRPGKKIIVMGIIDLEPDSFDISLTCGRDSEKEEPPYDVALKLTARFSDRQFLRSARVSGKWTQEEASTVYFPFIPDQPFRTSHRFQRGHASLPWWSRMTLGTISGLKRSRWICVLSQTRMLTPQRMSKSHVMNQRRLLRQTASCSQGSAQ
ncbi:galectin-related protein-like isoform X2 [Leuresthes tenuis]|uniref:galectin-related protein-like isoform X2 n=1 Tax=Leuresthes tenuis TaxID=355514 RepID=UPI003B505D0B